MILPAALLIFSSILFAVIGWALGCAMSYARGFEDGYDQAESFAAAEDLTQIQWQLATPAPQPEISHP